MLTSKERAELRGQATTLDTTLMVGKSGITDALIAETENQLDSRELVEKAYRDGVSILPGHVFYPHKNGGRNFVRLNYSYEPPEKIVEGMEILKNTIKRELVHEK